jgi:DNA-binding MarR family transcriptional regulator
VETVPSPADRRAKLIRRTAKGDEVTRTIRALVTRVEARWRREVGAERYAVFRAVLSELIEPPPARNRRSRVTSRG